MRLQALTAVSPIDGRYRRKVEGLADYFSEYALIKYRVKVEVLYFIALSDSGIIRKLTTSEKKFLKSLVTQFSIKEARRVKVIEGRINHDVKSVEYFIKEHFEKNSLTDLKEFVHFALTSEDVTNLAYSLMITDFINAEFLPALDVLISELSEIAQKFSDTPMLSRTHGQPASTTTIGKEFSIFVYRIKSQMKTIPTLTGKLNGAVGNYNAHVAAYPDTDWIAFSKDFIKSLRLRPNLITTQIESHDTFAELFHAIIRINNIVLDFDRDIWTYISQEYIKQKPKKGEVGSSTMPHKVNPIDFENSEGNLGIANSIFSHLADKLTISRLQRDLSDSTVQRSIGTAFAHSMISYQSTLKGLNKIEFNTKAISKDLGSHPELLAEAIQVILRREGAELPYESLKKLTRGKSVSLKDLHNFIKSLEIPEDVKEELMNLTPENYTGIAGKLSKLAMRK